MQFNKADATELIGILKGYDHDFEGAVETFSRGITEFPADARLYRHRGHRFMNLRRLDEAQQDFLTALKLLPQWEHHYEFGKRYVLWQLEQLLLKGGDMRYPDLDSVKAAGHYHAPLAFKIHYHLALTEHLLGNDDAATKGFEEALEHAINPDLLAATANWLVVLYTLTGKSGKIAELLNQVDFEQPASVNAYYKDLLLLYRGDIDAEQLQARAEGNPQGLATHGYGLAAWFLGRNRQADAVRVLEQVVKEGDHGAFGTVAAEIKLRALGGFRDTAA